MGWSLQCSVAPAQALAGAVVVKSMPVVTSVELWIRQPVENATFALNRNTPALLLLCLSSLLGRLRSGRKPLHTL
jgi:hypothetical protein